jgi:aspartate racemase
MRNIVILGGMGPQASVHLHDAILKVSRQHHSGAPDEYPSIVHISMKIPDFIGNKNNESVAIDIVNKAMQKHASKGDTVCIACNTAHNLLDQLQIPDEGFVSIIDAVVEEVVGSGVSSIGLLASPNTITSGLYEKPLKRRGIEVVLPNATQITQLEEIIRSVIDGSAGKKQKAALSKIASSLERRGAEGIILGCTELPVLGIDMSLPSFDSISALAKNVVKKHSLL